MKCFIDVNILNLWHDWSCPNQRLNKKYHRVRINGCYFAQFQNTLAVITATYARCPWARKEITHASVSLWTESTPTKIGELPLRNIVSHRRETDNFVFWKFSPDSLASLLSFSHTLAILPVGEWPVLRDKIITKERVLEGTRAAIEALAKHQRAIIGRQVIRGSIFRTMPAKPYGRPNGYLTRRAYGRKGQTS